MWPCEFRGFAAEALGVLTLGDRLTKAGVEPEFRLVTLFDNDAKLGNELGARPSIAGSAIVRSHNIEGKLHCALFE
jgi:hypothetical protein